MQKMWTLDGNFFHRAIRKYVDLAVFSSIGSEVDAG
jgi:hypothetical protein